jgi:hypothetical protein
VDRPDATPASLLDATQLARHLGVTRTWVYEHANQLGAKSTAEQGKGEMARPRLELGTPRFSEGPEKPLEGIDLQDFYW